MGEKIRCPRCQHAKSWSVRRGKRRCAACRYEWRPGMLPLRLTLGEWRRLLRWFVLGHSAEVIAQAARLHRQRVLRALLLVRQAMVRDVPPLFSGLVEVDETYVGGNWRNKRRGERAQGTKRGRGTTKQAVFGILCRGGQVWVEVVPNVEAKTLLPLLRQRVSAGSVVCSDTFTSYTGVAASGYIHRRGPRPGLQRPARGPRWRPGGLLGLSQAAAGSQRRHPAGETALVFGRVCLALQSSTSFGTRTGEDLAQANPKLIRWLE